jgi:hypothetical protein
MSLRDELLAAEAARTMTPHQRDTLRIMREDYGEPPRAHGPALPLAGQERLPESYTAVRQDIITYCLNQAALAETADRPATAAAYREAVKALDDSHAAKDPQS